MRLLKLTQKYAAVAIFIIAVAGLAAIAGAGGGPLVNQLFGWVVSTLETILMAEIPLLQMPLVVAVLFLGAVFFTFRFRFISLRAFAHSIHVIRGKYDNPDDPGDVSHFQALSSALSATVGLGNIAGVAIAVSLGGPGAVFWMMVVALFGMSSKFAECTLGQIYRQVDSEGNVRGGPMVYLRDGLADRSVGGVSLKGFGWFLSVLFAMLCMGASIGAGNMFQSNQAFAALSERVPWLAGYRAGGEVQLSADRAVDLEQRLNDIATYRAQEGEAGAAVKLAEAKHLVKFVATPREKTKAGPDIGFQTPDVLSIEESDWLKDGEDAYSLDLTYRAADGSTDGRLTLKTDRPLEGDSLGQLLERLRFGAAGSTADAEAMSGAVEMLRVSESDWQALDGRHRVTAALGVVGAEGQDAQKAIGEVVVMSAEPVEIAGLLGFLGQVAKPIQELADADVLGFHPIDASQLEADAWSQEADGSHAVGLPVKAESNGTRYNLNAEKISNVLIAELNDEQRKISQWVWLPSVRATNAKPMAGAETPRSWIFGLILAFLVGLVIVGGIKSIAKVAEKIVPVMCAVYILAGLIVIFMNVGQLGWAASIIFEKAFQLEAGWGALIGVFVQGVRRAAFSSEAGIGSAPIAHSAAKTNEPVREGIVAMLGPFIDTIVVCFITGMVIVISGVWAEPSTAGLEGVTLTAAAFGTELTWFPWVLTVAVVLFAFSTMISWSYYGERCWTFLFGDEQAMAFRFIFVFFVVLGAISSLGNVLAFGDYLLLAMAFPNILGVVMLSDEIDERLRAYWTSFKNDEFETFK